MAQSRSKPYLMTVLSGPHAGAEVSLGGARHRLGSAPENEIQLSGLDAEALRFKLAGKTLSLRPSENTQVASRGAKPFVPGKAATLPLPAHLTFEDGTSVYFCAAPKPARTGSRMAILALTLLLGGAVAAQVWMGGASFASVSNAAAALAPAPPAALTPKVMPAPKEIPVAVQAPAAPVMPECPETCEASAAQDLATMLEDSGLTGINITAGDGILRVSTSGKAAMDPRWRTVRAAYDAKWDAHVQLLVQKSRPTPKAPFGVASVWLGTPAEIVTRQGVTYRVGDRTPEGWLIEEIAAGRVDLSQSGDHIRIEF